ncbi:MAG: tRNA (adenosine(37)-N6)-dimethylallyltransferase MiaA [Pseudomonadota bacterium]
MPDDVAPPAVILIAGPTGSGKSAFALAIAQEIGGLIVNADALQVYSDLHIVSARPSAADTALAPHRLYGHIDGAESYSVRRWLDQACKEIAEARTRGQPVIVVGGTGLYFLSLLRGLAEVPSVPDTVRSRLRAEAESLSDDALYARLTACDPVGASRLDGADRQRVLRALEVFEATGQALSAWQAAPHEGALATSLTCRLVVAPDREALYRRIDARFEAMVAGGAVAEVERLVARDLDPALPIMKAIGVPQIAAVLKGELALAEAISAAAQASRRYAKRQMTWARGQMADWQWLSEVIEPDPHAPTPRLTPAARNALGEILLPGSQVRSPPG